MSDFEDDPKSRDWYLEQIGNLQIYLKIEEELDAPRLTRVRYLRERIRSLQRTLAIIEETEDLI